MLKRSTKKMYYVLTNPLMKISGVLYRLFRAPRTGMVKVQLGPGKKNYLRGWINVDANIFTAKNDVWANLVDPLPFHDATVDAMYSHHVIEHLPDLEHHFKEVFRCLKPGAVYRVGGPNGDTAIRKFMENDKAWFGDFPDKRNSIGGRFENFIFCRQEHLTILTHSFLEELMSDAGFINIRACTPVKETFSDLFQECLVLEFESDFSSPHTLIMEGKKPT